MSSFEKEEEFKMFYPDLDEVIRLSKSNNIIPISMEVYADMETPISLFKRFENNEYCFLLESVEGGEKWARYSFIGKDPFLIVKSYKDTTEISDRDGNKLLEKGNPVEIIKKLMEKYKGLNLPNLPRFNGGAVGFFGYDIIRFYEHLPDVPVDDLELPECHFLFVDEVLAFDHLKQKIHIIVNLHVDDNIERSYYTVTDRIKKIYKEISDTRWKLNDTSQVQHTLSNDFYSEFTSNVTKEEYCNMVMKAKEYIKNGDIFQVVL